MEAHWISSFTGNPVDLCRPCLWSPQRPHWEVPEKFQRSTSFDAVHLVILSTVDGPPILWGWNWWTRFNSLDLKLMHLGMIWWLPDSWDNGFQVRWRNWEVWTRESGMKILYTLSTHVESNAIGVFILRSQIGNLLCIPTYHFEVSTTAMFKLQPRKDEQLLVLGSGFGRPMIDGWLQEHYLSLAAPIPDVTPSPKNSPPFKISPIQ